MTLKILLTGFEPFAGAALNPSELAVRALAAAPPAGLLLVTAILPVTYAGAGPALRAALAAHRPDIMLATGLAGNRPHVAVERVAINVDDARIADNDGVARIDTPVIAGGPAAYFATLPIKAITAAIRAEGVPAEVSQSAGTFLCNHIFYLARHLAPRAGFIHLPHLAEPAGPDGLPLGQIVAALRAALAVLRDDAADLSIAEGAVS